MSLSLPAAAGDSPFGYVYTTDTHPQGAREFEQWVTRRHDQSTGRYDAWQLRSEIEYGVRDDLQTSLYLNYGRVSASGNQPGGTTGPGAFVNDSADPNSPYNRNFVESISNEWIWRVFSPYKDIIGLALYVEPSIGENKRELEGKIILHKNFLDDRLVWAANLSAALEKENFHGEWEKESEVELTTGLAWRFAQRWHAGLEYRTHRNYAGHGFSDSKREYSANFFGPSLHYAQASWWMTLTFLKQLGNAKAYTAAAQADIVDGRFYGEHHERSELRLRVGVPF
ncbi:MAG TPA: DUF6662 family protein [Burkholderiales bacterium]